MNEYKSILENVKRYVALNAHDEEAFIAICQKLSVRKRQFIVQPGFVCSSQTYVISGALRSYFVSEEGNEHTIQFALEDWFISDFNSYISQTPASLFVEALEDSQLLQLNYEKVENLCLQNAKFERYFRLVAQRAFAFSQRRVLANLQNSAEERYRAFEKTYPSIVQRVPQYTLASYLGMTPEFLSKLRRKMIEKS